MTSSVRTRIAPSPSGEPHVGTAYIALFNLCFARKYGGKFILRIEDTDQARSSKESEMSILESLKWLGLGWDEGPDCGGDFGPYRQSERKALYEKHILRLIQKREAYRCFCTPEDLNQMREKQKSKKENMGYFGAASPCRKLDPEESAARLAKGTPHVVRLAVPLKEGTISFQDEVRKETISKDLSHIDDQVLLKSDGFPTYHLASVVDDHLMKISHVIRGEEWINSTCKHILLYKAFDWEPPRFYHLGLLRNADGTKSKISKRKNPVSLRWFRAAGFYPPALLNFLGQMGYSRYREELSKEEKKTWEIFSLKDMTQDFDENRISSTGPVFDYVKLDDLNFGYVSKLSDDDYFRYLKDRLDYLKTYLKATLPLFRKRYLRGEKEITFWSRFLFKITLDYRRQDFEQAKLENFKQGADCLKKLKKGLKQNPDKLNSPEEMGEFIKKAPEEMGLSSKSLHMLARVTFTGSPESLPLYDAMALLGPYRLMTRCDEAAAFLLSLRH